MDAKQCDCCNKCFPAGGTAKLIVQKVATMQIDTHALEGAEAFNEWFLDVCKKCAEDHSAAELLKKCCDGLDLFK